MQTKDKNELYKTAKILEVACLTVFIHLVFIVLFSSTLKFWNVLKKKGKTYEYIV